MTTMKIVSALALVALAAQGCSTDVGDTADTETNVQAASQGATLSADGVEVANFTTRAGTRVTFVRGDDGELGFGFIGSTDRDDPELTAAKQAAGEDPVILFEKLTGRSAPTALKEAAAASRTNALAAESGGDTELDTPAIGLVSPIQPSAVSASFCNITNNVYSGSNAFIYCWPNQYSTPWVKRKADHLSCRIDAPNGGIRVWYKYWTAGGSHKPIDAWLSSNQYMEWHGAYVWARRYRECKTVENPSATKHHFRVAGHEYMAPLGYNPISVNFPDP